MNISTQRRTIDGYEVAVVRFFARRANALHIRLLKLLGPSLGQVFDSVMSSKRSGKSVLDLDISGLQISGAIATLAEKLEPAEFDQLCNEILAGTSISNKALDKEENFNEFFTGNLLLMYKVLAFSVEVHFPDFFGNGVIGNFLKGLATEQEPMTSKSEESVSNTQKG